MCGDGVAQALRRQEFLLPGELRTGYDVVACSACGFCRARPDRTFEGVLAEHYRSSRKYAYDGTGNVAASLATALESSSAFLEEKILEASPPLPERAASVLDVGCSNGQLLSRLAARGFGDLQGLDPAPGCRDVARRLFAIEVTTGTLESFETERRWDAVVLWNVLEHALDPREFSGRAARLVGEGGLLFVQVPDADRFDADPVEPFQELSLEHLSYFSARTLVALLAGHGFAPVEIRPDVVVSGRNRGAVLTTAFRRGAAPDPGPSDPAPFAAYLARSAERLARLSEAVDALVASGEELVVWGAGALAARLLVDTRLASARIAAFVDSDTSLHGRTLAGRPVVAPASLRGASGTVLVASVRWEDEIRATLAGDLAFRGRVVGLRGPGLTRS